MYRLFVIAAILIAGCTDPTTPIEVEIQDKKKIKVIDSKKDMEVEHIFYMNHEGSDMFLSNLVYAASAESAPSIQKMVFEK